MRWATEAKGTGEFLGWFHLRPDEAGGVEAEVHGEAQFVESGYLRPDVDPIDLMRAIYGLSTAGSADDWPAKARKFVDILLQGSRP